MVEETVYIRNLKTLGYMKVSLWSGILHILVLDLHHCKIKCLGLQNSRGWQMWELPSISELHHSSGKLLRHRWRPEFIQTLVSLLRPTLQVPALVGFVALLQTILPIL